MKMRPFAALMLALMLVASVLASALPMAQPLVYAEEASVTDDEAIDEETIDDEAMEDALAAEDEVVADPDGELEFIDSLIEEIDMPENALDAINGMTNILLVGIDARPKEKTGRSDTMIIMSLDSEHNSIKLTSFQRDLYVEIPGRKSNRMNAAYVFGGADLLKKTIKHNFGVDIDYYATVNFNTLADAIDQIGGLTITVEDKYVKRVNAVIKQDNKVLGNDINSGLLKEGGEQIMTGRQAQAYARYRYGDPQGDAGRTARQREVILKSLSKMKDMSLVSLGKMALDNWDKIETDMSLADMLKLAPAVFKLLDGEITELKIPVANSYSSKRISGMAVYVPNRTKNQKALADFLLSE